MTPRNWFVLGIRLFGLWEITYGFGNVANYANLTLKLYEGSMQIQPNSYLLNAAFNFALAALFLFGAGTLADWCDEVEPNRRSKNVEDV